MIRENHPYVPLFKAWAKLRDAERRRDTRVICQARREIGELRHALLRAAL